MWGLDFRRMQLFIDIWPNSRFLIGQVFFFNQERDSGGRSDAFTLIPH